MNSLLDKCNKLCLKMTEQRRIITQVLSESKDHPDVELVYKRASKIDKNIGIFPLLPRELNTKTNFFLNFKSFTNSSARIMTSRSDK